MKKIKFCPKCKTWKPLVEFQKSGQNIKSFWCKECRQNYRKIYYKINEDHCKILIRIWRENNKNRCKILKKIWHKVHSDYWNAATAKYLSDKDKRTPVWANLKMIKKFYTKAMKLTKETGIQYSVDHIIPLHGKNVSGFHVENNLQVITSKKNSQKHNTWIPR